MSNKIISLWFVTIVLVAFPTYAQQTHQDLLQQVKESRQQERQRIQEREARFLANKQQQVILLEEARAEFERFQIENNPLKQKTQQNSELIEALKKQIEQRKSELGDLESVVNQMTRDFAEAIGQSPTSMQIPNRASVLAKTADSQAGISLGRIESLWLAVQEEMTIAGQLQQFKAPVIDQQGKVSEQIIHQFGVFSSYQNGQFLRYVPETNEMLTVNGGAEVNAKNRVYFSSQNEFDVLYVDPTGGTLLGLLEWTPDWQERLEQGGVIGKIILALGAIGLLIIVWRMLTLSWQTHLLRHQLRNLNQPRENNPLGRILLKFKEHSPLCSADELQADSNRIDALQLQMDEAVLNEVGGLERGQNLLKLLAAIAPLLGLLGTVTGMIITFQSISFFGSGDPKLMAGGISQALITTVLGLIVAIPLLFGHSFISSLSENIMRRLEEQSTGLLAQLVERPKEKISGILA